MTTTNEYLTEIRRRRDNKLSLKINFAELPEGVDKDAIVNELSANLPEEYKTEINSRRQQNTSLKIDFAKVPLQTPEPKGLFPTIKEAITTGVRRVTEFLKTPPKPLYQPEQLREFEIARQIGVKEAEKRLEETGRLIKQIAEPMVKPAKKVAVATASIVNASLGTVFFPFHPQTKELWRKAVEDSREVDLDEISEGVNMAALLVSPVAIMRSIPPEIRSIKGIGEVLRQGMKAYPEFAKEGVPEAIEAIAGKGPRATELRNRYLRFFANIGEAKKKIATLSDDELLEIYKTLPTEELKSAMAKENIRLRNILRTLGVPKPEPVRSVTPPPVEPISPAPVAPEVVARPVPEVVRPAVAPPVVRPVPEAVPAPSMVTPPLPTEVGATPEVMKAIPEIVKPPEIVEPEVPKVKPEIPEPIIKLHAPITLAGKKRLKIPTMKTIYDPDKKFVFEFEGKPFITDAYLLEFEKVEGVPERKVNLEPIMAQVKPYKTELSKPIGYQELVKEKNVNIIVFKVGDKEIGLNSKYYNYLAKKYKNLRLVGRTPLDPVKIYDKDELKGLVMPMVLDEGATKPISPPTTLGRLPARPGHITIPEIDELTKLTKRYFLRTKGMDWKIDRLNDLRIGKIQEKIFEAPVVAKQVRDWIIKTGEKSEELIYNALQGKVPIDSVPEEIRPQVQKMRTDIDNLSRILIEKGVLPETLKIVLEKNIGKYVVRAYRLFNDRHYEPTKEVKDRVKDLLRRQWQEKVDKLKEKIGKAKGEPRPLLQKHLEFYSRLAEMSDEDMEGVIKSILDKRSFTIYTAGRKPISVPQNHFIKRKDIPKEFRDLYGEIENPVWLYLKTINDLSVIAHNTEFLANLSQIPNIFSNFPTATQFKRMPEGKRWGQFSGKYVDEDLYEFLNEINSPNVPLFIEKFIVDPFKWTKTVGSVPTHARNFLGNIYFSILKGNSILNPLNWKYYTEAAEIILRRKTKHLEIWKDLIRNNVVEVQYWGSEIPKMMDELLKLDPPNWAEKIYEWTIKKPIRFAGELYNAEDQIYRVAAVLKDIDKGIPMEQSAIEVDKFMTNYRKIPQISKDLRKWAIFGPFLSFRSEVIRITYNAAKEGIKQARQGKYGLLAKLIFLLSIPTLMRKISMEVNNIDEDEIEKFEKLLPPYRRGAQFVYYRDSAGNLKVFDLTYVLPTGDFERAIRSLIRGDITSFSDSLNLFMHPIFDAWNIVKEGSHPYLHYKIRDDNDPLSKQAVDTALEFLRTIYLPASFPIPSIPALLEKRIEPGALTGYNIKPIFDAYNEISDRYGRVKDLPEEIKNLVTGVRTWRVYPEIIIQNYRNTKRYELIKEKQNYKLWLKRNPKAPISEKQRQAQIHRERVRKIMNDLKLAGDIKLR